MAIKTASLEQCTKAVTSIGDNVTYYFVGEPGCGKSSILGMAAVANGDQWRKVGDSFPDDKYQYIYCDCPLMDLPDFAMPYVVNEANRATTHFAPAAIWGFNDPRPKYIMFDELSKAPKVVQPMFTRALLERCIGELPFAKGTRLFATGNQASDGVGDSMQGHINNRITSVKIGKPTIEEWISWGLDHGVHELILTGVHQYPHVMQSYHDDPNGDNPYIFNPKRNTGAFASPRSLYKASFICANRHIYGQELTQLLLEGTIGVSFAGDLMAYMDVADKVPSWEAIESKPKTADVPTSPAAQLLLVFGSIGLVTKKNAEAYTAYFFRFPLEVRMLWARQFKNRLEIVRGVKQFRDTLVADHWVFN